MSEPLERIAEALEEYNRRARDTPETRAEMAAIRRIPRRYSMLTIARGVPDLMRVLASAVPIPGEYWAQVEEDVREVACPCGLHPCVGDDELPVFCSCGRSYIYLGDAVRVIFSPKATLPVPVRYDPTDLPLGAHFDTDMEEEDEIRPADE